MISVLGAGITNGQDLPSANVDSLEKVVKIDVAQLVATIKENFSKYKKDASNTKNDLVWKIQVNSYVTHFSKESVKNAENMLFLSGYKDGTMDLELWGDYAQGGDIIRDIGANGLGENNNTPKLVWGGRIEECNMKMYKGSDEYRTLPNRDKYECLKIYDVWIKRWKETLQGKDFALEVTFQKITSDM